MKTNLKVFLEGIIDVSPLMIPVIPFGLIFGSFIGCVASQPFDYIKTIRQTGIEPNSTCQDCAGVVNGYAVFDCNGVPFGLNVSHKTK